MDRPTSTRQNAGASEFNLDAPASSQTETRLATRRHNGKEKATARRLTVRRGVLEPIRSKVRSPDNRGRTHRMVIMERQKRAGARFDQLQTLISQLRRHAPRWADRLSSATTDREFLDVLCKLFDLSSVDRPLREEAQASNDLATRIATFLSSSLHQGPTLKTLAEWLGYSEKYCSELFRSVMGESFSRYLARRRTEIASDLLLTTDKSIGDIAASVGFSDQFSFSHFFKRATGFSPRAFRATHARRQPSSTTKPQQSPSQ